MAEKKVAGYLAAQRRLILKRYQAAYGGAKDASDLVDLAEATAELEKVLKNVYGHTIDGVHEICQDALGISFQLDDPVTRAFLLDAGINISAIAGMTLARVRGAIIAGQARGEGIEAIAKRIRECGAFTPGRARTIARTELGHAANTAAVHTYRASGLVESVKIYDGEVHPFCAAWNGRVIPLAQIGSVPTLAHPNCVRAFGPIVLDKPIADPKPRGRPPKTGDTGKFDGEHSAVLNQLGAYPVKDAVSGARRICEAAAREVGGTFDNVFMNDPRPEKQGAWAFYGWDRNIVYGTDVTKYLKDLATNGKISTNAHYEALNAAYHEGIHGNSPMLKNWKNWLAGKGPSEVSKWWGFWEEAVTETKARRTTTAATKKSNIPLPINLKQPPKRKAGHGSAYDENVEALEWLEENSGVNGIEDKIWKGLDPKERTDIVADAVRPWLRTKLRDKGMDDFDVEAITNTLGNGAWMMTLRREREKLLGYTATQVFNNVETWRDTFEVRS